MGGGGKGNYVEYYNWPGLKAKGGMSPARELDSNKRLPRSISNLLAGYHPIPYMRRSQYPERMPATEPNAGEMLNPTEPISSLTVIVLAIPCRPRRLRITENADVVQP